ncbi:hypothetical protein GALL_521200 [mine drainage metagenome]|uniref:Uncharacterized protein n=1 Tax=mine drainage metagenome TaxID=410659 RepID=A0A1J5PER7_9ZZZZ
MIEAYSKGPDPAMDLLQERKRELARLDIEYEVEKAEIPILESEEAECRRDMDRALAKMQLASPPRVIELGQELYFGMSEWLNKELSRGDIEARFHRFIQAAKLDLSHPFRSGIWNVIRHPVAGRKKVEIRPNI